MRPETVNANRLIQDMLPLLQRAAGETIALKLDPDPASDETNATREDSQARQVAGVADRYADRNRIGQQHGVAR